MVVVVAGASGNVGSGAVRALSQLGVEVRALTRTSASEKVAPLKALSKVEVVECDLSDASTLAQVFDGVSAAFLTCANFRGQVQAEKNFIDAAVAAGCKYLVKLGTVRGYTTLDSSVNAPEYARFHAEIEAYLEQKAGEMKWTVLCPNWFMSNHLGDIFGTLPNNIIVYPLDPDAKAAMVDPRDVADIAAALLVAPDSSQHHGLKLDISGPEAITLSQIAALYTEKLGRTIQPVNCAVQAWIDAAEKSGFPDWFAQAVSHNFTEWAAGNFLFPTSPEALAAAPPKRSMAEWINEWAPRSPPPASA